MADSSANWRGRFPLQMLAFLALDLSGVELRAQRQPGQLLYADSQAVWFETTAIPVGVFADGRWLLFAEPSRRRLIEGASRREGSWDQLAPGHGLERIDRAVPLDGGRIAFLGVRGGERGWFIVGGGSVKKAPLPANATPTWLGETDKVVYRVASGSPELFVDSGTGPVRHDLGGAVRAVAWAPDGTAVYALIDDEMGAGKLLRVALATGVVDVLRERLYISIATNSLAVSPNGERLYLALAAPRLTARETRHDPRADRDLDIYELHLSTRALRPVVATPEDEFAPVVLGDHLYWTRNAYAESVVMLPVEGGAPRVLVRDALLPTWHPSGRRLAFTYGVVGVADGPLGTDAAVIALDPSGKPIGTPEPIVTGLHEDFTPVWSPDGAWLAYHSHRSAAPVGQYGGEGISDDIYVRASGAPMRDEIRVSDFGWEVGMPDWSPDGKRIVFDSWERGGRPGIAKPWIATLDRGHRTSLERLALPAGLENATSPSWSPDGEWIALDGIRDRQHELWLVRPNGSEAKKLGEFMSATYGGIDWTPDGTAIVYGALADRRMQLFIISATGGPPRRLTQDDANVIQPSVSPDGKWIAAMRLERIKQVWRMRLDQGSPR